MKFQQTLTHLLKEEGDVIHLGGGETLEYMDPNTMPFIASKDGQNFMGIRYGAHGKTHTEMLTDFFTRNDKGQPKVPHIITKNIRYAASNEFAKELVYDVANIGWLNKEVQNKYISGRVWFNHQMVGFWSNLPDTMKVLPLLREHIQGLTDDWIFDFKATSNVQAPLSAILNLTTFASRPKHETEMLIRQHIAPELKKESPAYRGSQKVNQAASNAGFKSGAEYRVNKVFGDSMEKKLIAVYVGEMGGDWAPFIKNHAPLQLFNFVNKTYSPSLKEYYPAGSTVTMQTLEQCFDNVEIKMPLRPNSPVYGIPKFVA